jgi:bacteriocin biosynthesis cyclodehydratase domain-containing protein
MVLKLDGRFATVWRDPFSLQLGVDPAQVVLREVTTAEERMIAALASGVSRSGLDMIARSAGAAEPDVAGLLRRLKPLLLPSEAASPAARVSIVGIGQTAERIAGTLALEGVAVSVSRTVVDDACDLGVVVGHYVLDPDSYGFWLRRDLPHLPVVFGDDSVQVGPVVEPGHSPCLYCLEHYRRDADASWSAIASQLWGRRSSSETPLVSAETAARVSRLVLDRLRSGAQRGRALSARSFRIDVASGEVTRRDWMPHPDCGCREIPRDALGTDLGTEFSAQLSAGRPGIGSAADSDQPTTTGVSASRA